MGDVIDMNAAEQLARLDDAPCRALAHIVEHIAAGAVNAGQPEDPYRDALFRAEGQPVPLRLLAPPGAVGGRRQRRRLIDQRTFMIAIDAGGREIADPAQSGCRQQCRMIAQQGGIAGLLGRNRDQQMGDRREIERVAEKMRIRSAILMPHCAGNLPSGRQGGGKPRRAIAETEAEQVVHC